TDPALMLPGWLGPNSQIGLTCANVPRSARVAPVNQNMTTETGVITGRLRRRSSANSAIITTGSTATCSQYARAMITCPGKSPPKIHTIVCVPMIGIDSVTPSSTPRLPTDNRSSGRMVPDTPATMPSTSKLTDQPVQPAWPAEPAGKVEPQQVRAHRRDEQQRGPVVELPHQQPAAHVEADVQRRPVRLAHRDAVQLAVRAVVADLRHARLVVEQQEHAGDRGYHERIHRDLPEQRRPPV